MRKGDSVADQEVRAVQIDNYVNLLRIKASEKGENPELDIQLEVAKMKLSAYSIDTAAIEKRILGA